MMPKRGEVWMFDCGMAEKVRPVLVLSIPFGDADRAVVTVVFHSTALRGSPFAFQDGDELRLAVAEPAEDRVGEFAVNLDVAFTGEGVGARCRMLDTGSWMPTGVGGYAQTSCRAGVAEQAAKDVR